MTTIDAAPATRRLKSWKEIAAYFGTDERTVKRWEASRALPIHRVPGGLRAPVYAFTDELESWLRRDQQPPARISLPRKEFPRAMVHRAANRPPLLAIGFVVGAFCGCLAALAADRP